MKKVGLIIITLVVLIIGVSGFMSINNSNAEESTAKQTKQASTTKQKEVKTEQKAPEKAYNIDKIVIPVQINADEHFKPFQDFSIELIKTIAAENNIPVELKELSFNDIEVALSRNEIDLRSMTSNTIDPKLNLTYSYLTTKLHPDLPERDYSFTVHKDNTELNDLLNDGIQKYKENGKLEELRIKYLGQ
jgi:glutamine transport system substrate-binding protein